MPKDTQPQPQGFQGHFSSVTSPPLPFPKGLACFLDMVRCGPGSSGDLRRTSPVVWMVTGPPAVVTAGLGTQGMVKHGGRGQPTRGAGPDYSACAWVGASGVDPNRSGFFCFNGKELCCGHKPRRPQWGRQVCWVMVYYKALEKRRLYQNYRKI